MREEVREAWGWQWLERLWLDTRLAVRLWLRTPGFSAIAIATIGLGIGASTALVGQVKAVFWTTLRLRRRRSYESSPGPHDGIRSSTVQT